MTDLYHIYYYLDKHYIRQQSGDYDLLSLFLCHQLGEDPLKLITYIDTRQFRLCATIYYIAFA